MADSIEPYIAHMHAMCPMCGWRTEQGHIEIKYVEKGQRSWAVGGVGFCEWCGASVRVVTQYLPIEFPTLPCPSCSQVVNYNFTIESVQMEEGTFLFKATATCPQCNKITILNKIIKSLRRIKGIKVGPLGVDLATDDSG